MLTKETLRILRFFAIFFAVFFVSAVLLFVIDFVPEKPMSEARADGERSGTAAAVSDTVLDARPESPQRVVIEKAGVDTSIENPSSRSLEVLDTALLSGAVRYPGSALLGEQAPLFLFGHQSYLPAVKNQAFKAFNGLQKLKEGDVIHVYSDTARYDYAVHSVSLVTAEDALIPLASDEQSLFLSTCNSFGDPGERYVVEARYLGRSAIN